jgi:hypothetical protein
LTRGDIITLLHGDRIALGTGGDASTSQDACRSLYWCFRHASQASPSVGHAAAPGSPTRSPSAPVQRRENSGFGTPPSPGGLGPRVSDTAPWAQSSTQDEPPQNGAGGISFEPMLPPAGDMLFHKEQRPSDDTAARRYGSGASPALRVPALLGSIHEERG